MPKINYPLIVSDFDMTFTNSKNEVPAPVVEAVNKYCSLGGVFAVCTGRILACIRPRLKQMGLGGLVVACQGSQIAEIQSGKILRSVTFKKGEAAEICAALEESGNVVELYRSDGFFTSQSPDDKYLNMYEKVVGVKAFPSKPPLSKFAAEHDEGKFCKVAALVEPKNRDSLYNMLYSRFGGRFDVTCSAKVLVEISPLGETKGRALKYLADYYGIPIEKTVAIGDNLNDITMIEAAGVGVAVANGEELLKQKADFVSVSSDECAVKQVIERFGYTDD